MTVVDPEPSRREKCACRIEVNGLVDLDSEKKIKMCSVHAAGFNMLDACKEALANDIIRGQRAHIRDHAKQTGTVDAFVLLQQAVALAEKGTP